MKVRYSPRALAQLEEVHQYIAQHNPRAATAVVVRIEELCETLRHPGAARGEARERDQAGIQTGRCLRSGAG